MTPSKLISWRKKNGLNQVELANILGVTKACISRWESGKRHIPPFLHLTLECVEKKGGKQKVKSTKTKKRKEVKK
jgi:DNA-binding transcriptional regulator YiaG